MFKAREATLRLVFESGEYDQFIIPHYQRSYVWGQDELENFWNDFIVRHDAGQLHLLGSVIISKTKSSPRTFGVVDGQQRLITCSIFIAALRDVWGEKFGYATEDYYNLDRFIQKSDRSRGTIVKVQVADSLREVFDNIVVARNAGEAKPKSDDQRSVIKAYTYFYDKLKIQYDNNAGKEKDKQDLLWQKVDNLFNSSLVLVTLDDEDDAYEVFEGFNARGVELSIADLFKNLFLQKINGNDEEKQRALEKWNEITQIVNDLKVPRFTMNTFLRYYWIRNNTFVGEKQLYKRIKKDTKNYQQLLGGMHAIALDLKVLFGGSAYDIKDVFDDCSIKYADSINESIKALRLMNTQSYMVWLMSITDRRCLGAISPKLFAKSLKQVENFSFRYFAISKQPSNRIEKLYANFSKQLFELATKKDNQRMATLVSDSFKRTIDEEKLLPTREQFLTDFESVSLQAKNKGFIRYLLSKIEQSYDSGEKVIDQQSVNIEHILPQKPGKEWMIDAREHKLSFNRLGNLTILLEALNSSMSNKPILEKVQYFEKSDLRINKEIVKTIKVSNAWTSTEIGQRQLMLAEKAEELWRVDI